FDRSAQVCSARLCKARRCRSGVWATEDGARPEIPGPVRMSGRLSTGRILAIATATCTSPCWVYARMCLRCTAQGCRLVDVSDRSGTDMLSGKGAPRRLRGHSEMLQPGPRVHRCLGIRRERAPSSRDDGHAEAG